MAKKNKTKAQLEEELAKIRLALSEANEDEDDDAEKDAADHADEVDVKEEAEDEKEDDDEDLDEDANPESDTWGGPGSEHSPKDSEGDAADAGSWAKFRLGDNLKAIVGEEEEAEKEKVRVDEEDEDEDDDKVRVDEEDDDSEADDKDSLDEEDEEDDDKEIVGEDADEDDDAEDKKVDEEADDDEDDEVKTEAKAIRKRLRKLMQSYMPDEQPPVTTGPDPLLGGERPDKQKGKDSDAVVEEGIKAMFKGKNLSEGFKKKARTVMEAAVKLSVLKEKKAMERAALKALATMVEEVERDLTEKANDYLNYSVGQFLKENKVAVANALKVEIFESFFEGLKALYVEHDINMPTKHVNMLEAKQAEVDELSGALNTMTKRLIQADKAILEMKKKETLNKLSEGLADTQKAQLENLLEGVEAADIATFKKKATILRESYFKKKKVLSEKATVDMSQDDGETSNGNMTRLLETIE